jgi:hypothetical protein
MNVEAILSGFSLALTKQLKTVVNNRQFAENSETNKNK